MLLNKMLLLEQGQLLAL